MRGAVLVLGKSARRHEIYSDQQKQHESLLNFCLDGARDQLGQRSVILGF